MMSNRRRLMLFAILYAGLVLQNAASRKTHNKRDVHPSSSLPGDLPIISLKLNATIMACSNAVVFPSTRMVHLSDSQMRQMLEGLGGNYLHDYMAATQEEATENFPNMLMLVDPDEGLYASVPMSVYDNYVAKSVLMNDLNRIKFYLLNNTTVNGKPDMGMYVINNTDTDTVPHPANSVGNERRTTTQQQHTGSFEGPSTAKQQQRTGSLEQTTPIATNAKKEENTTPTNNRNTTISTNNSFQRTQTSSTPTTISTTQAIRSSTTNNSSNKPTPSPVKLQTSPESANLVSTENPWKSPTTTFTSAPTPSIGLDGMGSTVTKDPLISLSASTLDPDVQKSLEELNKYLQGFGGIGQSDVSSTMRQVQTTVDPDHLARLADAVRRKKRNADGTTTHENYCELKGSPTEDRQYLHICSSCAATTELTGDFFPRFINEVVCKTGDTECFKIGDTVHGKCRQRYFTLNMLRKTKNRCMVMRHNGQSLVLDDWQLVPKRIRVGCECTINKLSFLKPYISQDSTPIG